jgi:ribonuclease BN (tRNA processing enzyme)
MRLTAGDQVLAYIGDGRPCPDMVYLAGDADLLIAEATFATEPPDRLRGHVTTVVEAAQQATKAGSRRLLLTH